MDLVPGTHLGIDDVHSVLGLGSVGAVYRARTWGALRELSDATRIRGRLNIVSPPGRGTTIEATVPVPPE